MNKMADSRLPDGEYCETWEVADTYTHELHVDMHSPYADDSNEGTRARPLASISAAAVKALPGTRILIHEGVYRECVRPPRGGEGPNALISYEHYGSDEVVVKASEIVTTFSVSTGWRRSQDPFAEDQTSSRIWEHKLEPDMFRGYNPFCAVNILHDRLFIEYAKTDMTTYLNRRGMIFCDGEPLVQVALYHQINQLPGTYWVEANGQTVHFRLKDDSDPHDHLIEVTCREQCIAPSEPFLAYIKIRGITCAHAATGAPVPQRGSISLNRGHHWVIEDCTVDWSNGVGIDIGNECWHHTLDTGQILGFDIIRRCKILHAGVCGIAAMFVDKIIIEDNLVEGTGWQRMELSWEAAGLKAHCCRNSLIRRNIFRKTIRADHLWLDVANENNRITSNLFLDGIEQREAIFIECSRDGINLVDNNIFWNIEGRFKAEDIEEEAGSASWYKMDEAGIVNGYAIYGEGTDHLRIAHNFFGLCRSAGYFAKIVPFRIDRSGRGGTSRDARLHNNIFYACGEAAIKFPTEKNHADGNLYLNMPGGYLRIMHPAPVACLNLQAWQGYYNMDRNSAEGELQIVLDTENYQMSVASTSRNKKPARWQSESDDFVRQVDRIPGVDPYELALNDFFGTENFKGSRLPGPFTDLPSDVLINIDPRRIERIEE